MQNKIRVSIIGGTGYTASELIRILLYHPMVEIVSIVSSTSKGLYLTDIHKDLIGETNLKFTETINNPQVIFLCLGHGLSKDFLLNNNLPDKCKIIDLGNDFRLSEQYGNKKFIYGLSDTFSNEIKNADYIANPGCFATAIQCALVPLAKNNILDKEIHITAITGSTGAGKKLSEKSHFSYREGNISIYKPFEHQHIGEIKKSLSKLSNGKDYTLNFVPMRGNFTRGIFASVYTKLTEKFNEEIANKQEAKDSNIEITANKILEKIENLYKDYYKNSPFVHICKEEISLKEVINTNKVLLHIEIHNGYVHITSILDNLLKGASGQAVENMNLMFNLKRDCGLRFKPSAF